MTTKVGFWTAVKYGNPTFSQKIQQSADSYFNFGGRVAVVIPGIDKNGSITTRLQKEQGSYWLTALKIISYFTVILPILMFGIKLISRTCHSFHTYLPSSSEIQKAKTHNQFNKHVPLLHWTTLHEEELKINFAIVKIDGKEEMIPLQKPDTIVEQFRCNYFRYAGSPEEALLKILQDKHGNRAIDTSEEGGAFIQYILEHPHNHCLEAKGFLDYLIDSNDQGISRLHTINPKYVVEIFGLFKKDGISYSLQSQDQEESLFMRAALDGCEEEAQFLWQKMKEQKVELTETDRWIRKAFTNDCNFTHEEFLQLSQELQWKIFQIANVYIYKELLERLRNSGMYQEAEQPQGFSLFSCNMDAIAVGDTLLNLLGQLREEGRLLTKRECDDPNSLENMETNHRHINSVLGLDYVKQKAEELKLSNIKVPKTKIVIENEEEEDPPLMFTLTNHRHMQLQCPGLSVYFERITPVKRKATRDELETLLTLIKEINYFDIDNKSIIIGRNEGGEEGIYFVDANWVHFGCCDRNDMEDMGHLIDESDRKWYSERIKNLFPDLDRRMNQQVDEWGGQKQKFTQYGFVNRSKPFAIPVDSVLQNSCSSS